MSADLPRPRSMTKRASRACCVDVQIPQTILTEASRGADFARMPWLEPVLHSGHTGLCRCRFGTSVYLVLLEAGDDGGGIVVGMIHEGPHDV